MFQPMLYASNFLYTEEVETVGAFAVYTARFEDAAL